MKKWLIALGILLTIGILTLAVAAYQLNTRYGWMASSPISHDVLATPDTRLILTADSLRFGREMEPYLPENIALPDWLPIGLPSILPRALPREIALLGHADYRAGSYQLTLFANEQRGGPGLLTYLNTKTRYRQLFSNVTWDEPGFQLEKRGLLRAQGHIDLPVDLETTIRESWSASPRDENLTITGGHLAEGVLDNRNGELLALIGTLAPNWGTNLNQLRQNPMLDKFFPLLPDIYEIRAAVDFESTDTLLIQLRIQATKTAGSTLEGTLPLVLVIMAVDLERYYGLVLTQEVKWDDGLETCIADIKIEGVEEKLKAYFLRTLPVTAPPQPPEAG